MLHPIGGPDRLDNWQTIAFLFGLGSTGKSTIVNDVVGCYTEHVRIPIQQKHADAFVTAQMTYVTGYERVFQAESTQNCVVLSPHYGRLPQSRSVFDRRVDIVAAPPEKPQGNQ